MFWTSRIYRVYHQQADAGGSGGGQGSGSGQQQQGQGQGQGQGSGTGGQQQGAGAGGGQQQGGQQQGQQQQGQQQQGQQQGQQTGAQGDAARVVPDKYVLMVPAGGRDFFDEASDLAMIQTFAKENKLTQEEAQQFLVDQVDMRRATHERLMTEVKAHSEIGGDKLEAAQQLANRTIDKFLPKDSPDGKRLRSDLARLGLANYPPLIVLLSRVGRLIAEDRPGSSSVGLSDGAGGAQRTVGQTLYDKTAPDGARVG